MSRHEFFIAIVAGVLYALIFLYLCRPAAAPARDYCYRPAPGEMYYTTSGQQPCPRDLITGPNYCPAP